MGYLMQQLDNYFYMEKETLDDALKVTKALLTFEAKEHHGPIGYVSQGGQVTSRHYGFVQEENVARANNFKDAAEAFRWDMWIDDAGDIYGIIFNGEKYTGDELTFLNAIAPYVRAGSYIEMQGEEGERWKWFFNGKECIEHTAEILYPDIVESLESVYGKQNHK